MNRNILNRLLFLLLAGCTISCNENRNILPFAPNEKHAYFPEPTGFVNDFEGIFSPEEEIELNNIVTAHELKTTNQIAVVTLKSYSPLPGLNEYALQLARYWKVGQKGKDNGLLIAFGKGLREVWITNAIGVQDVLTDSVTKHVIDSVMIPEYMQSRYFEGTKRGLMEIVARLEKRHK